MNTKQIFEHRAKLRDEYRGDFDEKFLMGMGIKFVFHQPWQIGLFHEEFTGKFVWYPKKGTLMVEFGEHQISNLGRYLETEEMYNKMMEVINNNLK
jgi:hypothetical protein